MVKWIFLVTYQLLVLHGPGGQAIDVNPGEVVSLREPRKDEGHFSKEVRCLVNTSDGKFSAVVEDCDIVRAMIENGKEKR